MAESQGSASCQVHRTGCLSSADLVLESWRILRELPIFSLVRILKILVLEKECLSSTVSEFASKSEGKQAKANASYLCILSCWLPPEDVGASSRCKVSLPTSADAVKKIPHSCTGCLGFCLFQI